MVSRLGLYTLASAAEVVVTSLDCAASTFPLETQMKRAHRGSIAKLSPDPAAPRTIPSTRKTFSEEKIVDVAEVNQRQWLEESAQ